MNPFKAIGKGIAKGAKALVGKGGEKAPRTFSNRGGSAAPTDAGYRTPKAEIQAPLPNVRRSGGAAGTYSEAKAPVAAKGPTWGKIPGAKAGGGAGRLPSRPIGASAAEPAKPSVAQKAKPVASASSAGSFVSRSAMPERQLRAGAGSAKAAVSAKGSSPSTTIGQRISQRARSRFYGKAASRQVSSRR